MNLRYVEGLKAIPKIASIGVQAGLYRGSDGPFPKTKFVMPYHEIWNNFYYSQYMHMYVTVEQSFLWGRKGGGAKCQK